MIAARIQDGRDHTVDVPDAYQAPAIRPVSLAWCHRCQVLDCVRHPLQTFYQSRVDPDGIWVYRNDAEVLPA